MLFPTLLGWEGTLQPLAEVTVVPSTSKSVVHRHSGGKNLGPHRAPYPAPWLHTGGSWEDRGLNVAQNVEVW